MSELAIDKNYKLGARGAKIRDIQEWLSLNGFGVVPDGGFGAGADFAVREFQRARKLKVDGVVGRNTFRALVEPMKAAVEEGRLNGAWALPSWRTPGDISSSCPGRSAARTWGRGSGCT